MRSYRCAWRCGRTGLTALRTVQRPYPETNPLVASRKSANSPRILFDCVVIRQARHDHVGLRWRNCVGSTGNIIIEMSTISPNLPAPVASWEGARHRSARCGDIRGPRLAEQGALTLLAGGALPGGRGGRQGSPAVRSPVCVRFKNSLLTLGVQKAGERAWRLDAASAVLIDIGKQISFLIRKADGPIPMGLKTNLAENSLSPKRPTS